MLVWGNACRCEYEMVRGTLRVGLRGAVQGQGLLGSGGVHLRVVWRQRQSLDCLGEDVLHRPPFGVGGGAGAGWADGSSVATCLHLLLCSSSTSLPQPTRDLRLKGRTDFKKKLEW